MWILKMAALVLLSFWTLRAACRARCFTFSASLFSSSRFHFASSRSLLSFWLFTCEERLLADLLTPWPVNFTWSRCCSKCLHLLVQAFHVLCAINVSTEALSRPLDPHLDGGAFTSRSLGPRRSSANSASRVLPRGFAIYTQ